MAELIWLPLGGDLSQGFAPVIDRAAVNLVYFVGLGTIPGLGSKQGWTGCGAFWSSRNCGSSFCGLSLAAACT